MDHLYQVPCSGCGQLGVTVYCADCAADLKCEHGESVDECDACLQLSDLAFDTW